MLVDGRDTGALTSYTFETTIAATAQDGSGVSATCKVTVREMEDSEEQKQPDASKKHDQQMIQKKGRVLTDASTKAIYKVVKQGKVDGNSVKGAEIEFVKPIGKAVSVEVRDKVRIKGVEYKIISIAPNAFKSSKKLVSLKMGKNIRIIGSNACNGCKKLKNVIIGKNVTTINSKAFKGIYTKAVVKVPGKKLRSYKSLLRARGISKKAKIKK